MQLQQQGHIERIRCHRIYGEYGGVYDSVEVGKYEGRGGETSYKRHQGLGKDVAS